MRHTSGDSPAPSRAVPPAPTVPPPAPTPAAPKTAAPAAAPAPAEVQLWAARERRTPLPGVYALDRHVPRPADDPDDPASGRLWPRALIALAAAVLFAWQVMLWEIDLLAIILNTLLGVPKPLQVAIYYLNYLAYFGGWCWLWYRIGRWGPLVRRLSVRYRATQAAAAAARGAAEGGAPAASLFPELRRAGHPPLAAAADRLDRDAAAGRLNDVDYARLQHAWQQAGGDRDRADRFAAEVAANGAAAFGRAGGDRDLPARSARHDLKTAQVRLGTVADDPRNPAEYRGAGLALDPSLLGTSVLAVGSGTGAEPPRVLRPVAESLGLQALAGAAAVVALGGPHAPLGPRDGYDVLVLPGSADGLASPDRLDLYGTATPETAARCLADALVPPGVEDGERSERARVALRQLLVPHFAAYGCGPSLRVLRELLEGEEAAMRALGLALDERGLVETHAPELRARVRQQYRNDDVGALLADRLALLDVPAVAGALAADGGVAVGRLAEAGDPLRVRIELPHDSHPEAAEILARLVAGQFLTGAAGRSEDAAFAALLVDDAAPVVDERLVRGLARLRAAGAAAVLALPTLADVPERLREPLVAAVGCRVALPGLPPWDGRLLSEAWGTTWRDERSVTRAPDRSGGVVRRAGRAVRGAVR
ncbi:hypothetical protein BIV57_22340, partial [Mangrovactinospora gilvigrisea]